MFKFSFYSGEMLRIKMSEIIDGVEGEPQERKDERHKSLGMTNKHLTHYSQYR